MPLMVAIRRQQTDFVKERFLLSPVEARLVVHLVQGTSLKSSAEALGITYETVRTYVKSTFRKTGTHRQAELVLTVFHAMRDRNPPVPAAMALAVTEEVLPPFGGLPKQRGTQQRGPQAREAAFRGTCEGVHGTRQKNR
jgi:DNA-binding CsgD family transcriptional regulator